MNPKRTDIAVILGKGLFGAIPFVGPLISEIVGTIIPNQRIDRIESFLKLLDNKIGEDDKEKINNRIRFPESVDLMEDSFIQVSRALTEERKGYIASLFKNSLSSDDLSHLEYKQLLSILGDLNDIQILLLRSKTLNMGMPGFQEFWEKHEDVLTPPPANSNSSQDDFDRNAIFKTYEADLVRLGLLKTLYKKPKLGNPIEFDEATGMMKIQRNEITNLGRLLLRSIGQS